ncbi:hypothetical protein I3842_10G130900 [Carya illinoinensis]|uniref:Uncharacterized protein n=1 Tax=Carya illinoinensis TaxID=32201 RepID=A0A922DYQ7_CARIL|nr:hypothetical protein I3842_10G130900 [Carya illinoinensis]
MAQLLLISTKKSLASLYLSPSHSLSLQLCTPGFPPSLSLSLSLPRLPFLLSVKPPPQTHLLLPFFVFFLVFFDLLIRRLASFHATNAFFIPCDPIPLSLSLSLLHGISYTLYILLSICFLAKQWKRTPTDKF